MQWCYRFVYIGSKQAYCYEYNKSQENASITVNYVGKHKLSEDYTQLTKEDFVVNVNVDGLTQNTEEFQVADA